MKTEELLGQALKRRKMSISSAESCTAGTVSARICSVSGASEYFKGAIVAYHNEVKMELLGVSPETLQRHGAVSRETVSEMALGAMKRLKTDCSIATSGIAGPGGGTPEKPVGTVWLAAAIRKNENTVELFTRLQTGDDGRDGNVQKATENVLRLLLEHLD